MDKTLLLFQTLADLNKILTDFQQNNGEVLERLEQGQHRDEDIELLNQLGRSILQANNGELEEITLDDLMEL